MLYTSCVTCYNILIFISSNLRSIGNQKSDKNISEYCITDKTPFQLQTDLKLLYKNTV